MPTLVRLLTVLAILIGIVYGIMAALVYFVQPTRTEVTVPVTLPEAEAARDPQTPAPGDGLSELRP
ncbi:hypothetical protein [Jiella endophytica]|uniref:hypothetical protein n=1 Tax=Jiella endophytica TaxID=2558362 RepID=UPI001FDFE9E3|nr:hypothetical protein [Jiella endophytica]